MKQIRLWLQLIMLGAALSLAGCDGDTGGSGGNPTGPTNPANNAPAKASKLPVVGSNVAGNEHGNGGNVVVCADKDENITSIELFDYYEARELYDFHADLPAGGDVWEKVRLTLERLKPLDPQRYELYSTMAAMLSASMRLIPSARLSDVGDINSLILPRDCQLWQAAVRIVDGYKFQFYFDETLWNAMNTDQQAGLLLHEIMHVDMYDEEKHDSTLTRRFNANLADSQKGFASMNLPKFITAIDEMGIHEVTINGTEYDTTSVELFPPEFTKVKSGCILESAHLTVPIKNAKNSFATLGLVREQPDSSGRREPLCISLDDKGYLLDEVPGNLVGLTYGGKDFQASAANIVISSDGYLMRAKITNFESQTGNPFRLIAKNVNLTLATAIENDFSVDEYHAEDPKEIPAIECTACSGSVTLNGDKLKIVDGSEIGDGWAEGEHDDEVINANRRAELQLVPAPGTSIPVETELGANTVLGSDGKRARFSENKLLEGFVTKPFTYNAYIVDVLRQIHEEISLTGRVDVDTVRHDLEPVKYGALAVDTLFANATLSTDAKIMRGLAGCVITSRFEAVPETLPDGRKCLELVDR